MQLFQPECTAEIVLPWGKRYFPKSYVIFEMNPCSLYLTEMFCCYLEVIFVGILNTIYAQLIFEQECNFWKFWGTSTFIVECRFNFFFFLFFFFFFFFYREGQKVINVSDVHFLVSNFMSFSYLYDCCKFSMPDLSRGKIFELQNVSGYW